MFSYEHHRRVCACECVCACVRAHVCVGVLNHTHCFLSNCTHICFSILGVWTLVSHTMCNVVVWRQETLQEAPVIRVPSCRIQSILYVPYNIPRYSTLQVNAGMSKLFLLTCCLTVRCSFLIWNCGNIWVHY